ncbi:MAG: 50S ribosomal protein L4 [Deltaproteobacteria bacterium]|nr:50S ribosomal protein L4 [Deltaproteobacteria bacterium]
MAIVDVLNSKAEKVSQTELVDTIFNIPVKGNILHEVVTMQLAKRRSGSAAVKHRSDVRGSGRKMFRQKGTGRARRGDIKSPLLRGGYAYKVPKRVKRTALKMALSSKLKEEKLVVLEELKLDEIKTREFVKVMNALDMENVLIITEKKNENLEISARNVPRVKVLRVEGLNVYDILKYKNVVLLESSIKSIEGRLL